VAGVRHQAARTPGARAGYRPRQAYAAQPMTSYGTDHAGACLDFLCERMVGWEIIDPAGVFADTADWLARWPSLHRDLSVVIVFGNEQGHAVPAVSARSPTPSWPASPSSA
jgi:hypothetical protein